MWFSVLMKTSFLHRHNSNGFIIVPDHLQAFKSRHTVTI